MIATKAFVRSGASGLILGLITSTSACGEDGPLGDIAEQCGLDIDCEAGGFAEGKASISGVASIDSFFGAAIDLDASMRGLSGELRAELDAIAVSVGAQPGAGGAEIADQLDVFLEGYISGGLTIEYQPPRCAANLEVSAAAAAECDAEVDPGSVSVRCEGSCTLDASAEATCEGGATVMCSGTAPMLDCSGGTCTGSCSVELTAEAQCDGTCRGTCRVGDTEMNDFEGTCQGQCQGQCVADLSAGGQCGGSCEGQCDWEPGAAGCSADATLRCEAEAGASVECNGTCEGSAEPPSVSAECEATVEAKADASIECTPPTLALAFEWNGEAAAKPATPRPSFAPGSKAFRAHLSAIIALRAKADVVVDASANLAAEARTTIQTAVEDLDGDASLKVAFGARCALLELPVAAESLEASVSGLATEIDAAVTVVGRAGG